MYIVGRIGLWMSMCCNYRRMMLLWVELGEGGGVGGGGLGFFSWNFLDFFI